MLALDLILSAGTASRSTLGINEGNREGATDGVWLDNGSTLGIIERSREGATDGTWLVPIDEC